MKKYLLTIILSLFVSSVAIARSTGCKEGNCENGFGKWVYTDKTTYEGEWVGTKKNGKGVETWPNGYIYKGEFKNSEWSGLGILTFPDGSTYEGEWAKGFMNGTGPSGLASAYAAAKNGAKVILAEDKSRYGGSLLTSEVTIGNQSGQEWAEQIISELKSMPNVIVKNRSQVFGYYDHNMLVMTERVSDHLPKTDKKYSQNFS